MPRSFAFPKSGSMSKYSCPKSKLDAKNMILPKKWNIIQIFFFRRKLLGNSYKRDSFSELEFSPRLRTKFGEPKLEINGQITRPKTVRPNVIASLHRSQRKTLTTLMHTLYFYMHGESVCVFFACKQSATRTRAKTQTLSTYSTGCIARSEWRAGGLLYRDECSM